jgi:hypothetical protein
MTKKELQQDRDDWKAIAEMNAEKIDELRAIIDRFQSPKSDTLAELKELANADRLKC